LSGGVYCRQIWQRCVRLLDLVGFFDLLIGYGPRGGAAHDQKTNRQTSALEQRTAR